MPLSDHPATGRIDLEASSEAFKAYSFPITNANGNAVTGWSSSDILTAQVWRGDNQPPLENTGVSLSWNDATNGIVRIVTDGTHELSASTYQWRLLATNNATTYEVCRGDFIVKFAPAASTSTLPYSKRPYTTIDDLRTVAPWIDTLKSQYDQTDFLEQQLAARAWFDDLVGRSYANNLHYTNYNDFVGQPWEVWRDETPAWLRKVIETGNGIKITDKIRRAIACYAAHLICKAQIAVKDDNNAMRNQAILLRREAANLITTSTIYVRSSLTSPLFDTPINLGVSRRN